MRDESSDNKASYYEQLFANMNQANILFKARLTWYISKGYYKQMLIKVDRKEMKAAYQLAQKAIQFYRIFKETIEHNSVAHPTLSSFKSEDKCEEFMKKLQKLSTILLAEIAFMQGMDTFTSATRVSEDLNMDEVYDALDLFSNASKVAFAQEDVELEARCEAWLGKIYEKALKKESKAVGHYSNVVRLAVTMRDGRDVTGS